MISRTSRRRCSCIATAFAQRNYAVLMPARRGFGLTGGEFAEDAGSCSDPHFQRGERAAADDVLAAYRFARKLPYVDGSRIILAGQSAGGVASLYAAAQAPEGLVAVLAFAAGRGGNPALMALRPSTCCSRRSAPTDISSSATKPVSSACAGRDRPAAVLCDVASC